MSVAEPDATATKRGGMDPRHLDRGRGIAGALQVYLGIQDLREFGYRRREVATCVHKCYDMAMSRSIGVRELRNDVSGVLRRVEAGDEYIVTVHGRPIARVTPVESRPRTMPADVFFAAVDKVGADAGLLTDLAEAVPDSTDDL